MANTEGKLISLKCFSDLESAPDAVTLRGSGDFAVGRWKILFTFRSMYRVCMYVV